MSNAMYRHIAHVLILDHARDIEYLTISEHAQRYGLEPEAHDKLCDEIDGLIRSARVTVSWPEEKA